MRRFIVCLLVIVSIPFHGFAAEGEYVVLMQSVRNSSDSMKPIADALTKDGYEVVSLQYPDEDVSLNKLLALIDRQVDEAVEEGGRVHFVGFAMGCVVLRAYLEKHRPDSLGRVVMLAPPRKGNEPGDYLKNTELYEAFYGPALADNRYGEVNYTLGVLAGDRTAPPPHGQIDAKTLEKTTVAGLRDHLILHGVHAFLVRSKAAQQQVVYFLSHSKFDRPRKRNY